MVLSTPSPWTSTWPKSHSLVTLLLIYSVTRRRCSSLHDDTLGTTVHKNPYLVWHHRHLCDIDVLQNKADVRIRLHAKKVFVRGWEMVPKVHRFQEVGLAIVNFLCPVFFTAPSTRLPTHLLPHSVKRLRLLWSGHRGASKHCEDKLPLTSVIIVALALYDGCSMVTLCSSGQGTTSDLSFCLKCCVGEALHCCFG